MNDGRLRLYCALLVPLGLFAACAADMPLPDEPVKLSATSSALSNGIRVGCEAVIGDAAAGPTVDFCMTADGNGITRIDFMTDILGPFGGIQWKFDMPRDEPLQVLGGCNSGSTHCSIAVTPRCDGEMRRFRALVKNFGGVSGEAMAMIPRATSCPNSTPRTPRPPFDSDNACATEGRGFLCGGTPELPNQCDGFDACVDCVDNGGCSESAVCSISQQTCVDFNTPQPPAPPIPRALPPPDVAGWPDPASRDCTGRARGIVCNFPTGASVPDQCDGSGSCVDCIDSWGCNDQSLCSAQQTCAPKTTTPPMSNIPGMNTWIAFTNALDAGQRDVALSLIFSESRPQYEAALLLLGSDIQTLSRDWSTPEVVTAGPSFVTYLVMDNADSGGVGHLVTLVQENGRWVVDQL